MECNDQNKVDKIRLAWGAMGPYVLRSKDTEKYIEGKKLSDLNIEDSIEKLRQELNPIDDIRSSAAYRKKVAINLLHHFLTMAKKKSNP